MHPRLPRLRDLLLTATALRVAPVAAGPRRLHRRRRRATIQGQGGQIHQFDEALKARKI
jgi:hypothetical protein